VTTLPPLSPPTGRGAGGQEQKVKLTHDDESSGEIHSRGDAETLRESIRGQEYRYGIVSNAIDFALSGDERHLVYLSPRDRRRAEELAREIVAAMG
jgi:hypothetical protein